MMWNLPLFPDQASDQAAKVDGVTFFLLAITVAFTVLIAGQVIFFGIKYRMGSKADRSGKKSASHRLEAFWIGGTFILCVIMYGVSTHVFFQLYDPPPDASEVYVVGKQWMWYLQHPEGKRETNELHVPIGKPIKLLMTSQDTIHSFYIPAFRIKQDVLPGRYTSLWFRPTKVGKYHLFCAEYCGANHSRMGGYVTVMELADYEVWLSSKADGSGGNKSMASAGAELFQQHHCAGCHGENGQGGRGPSLIGLLGKDVPIAIKGGGVTTVKADEKYIRDSILEPQSQVVAGYDAIMPSYKDQISEPDLLQIIAYIKGLGTKEAGQ